MVMSHLNASFIRGHHPLTPVKHLWNGAFQMLTNEPLLICTLEHLTKLVSFCKLQGVLHPNFAFRFTNTSLLFPGINDQASVSLKY